MTPSKLNDPPARQLKSKENSRPTTPLKKPEWNHRFAYSDQDSKFKKPTKESSPVTPHPRFLKQDPALVNPLRGTSKFVFISSYFRIPKKSFHHLLQESKLEEEQDLSNIDNGS
jgi:hypothetical protein